MRNPRFLHIGYYSPAPGVNVAAVDKAVESEVLDWLRYAQNCYLVWTASNTEMVCRTVSRVPGVINVFVTAVSLEDAFANLPSWAWEWLQRDRGYGTLQVYNTEPIVSPPMLPPPPLFPKIG